ncbi:hypothetical protein [Burkholderia sp. BCC1640]|uniref:hypothetical protein n=1 Tax=Burkholderia sp. BCC1640 TaxID=2676294 RepID=UPI0015889474|nr:hypothetical protein [Burkholderia sp. BCC1640]
MNGNVQAGRSPRNAPNPITRSIGILWPKDLEERLMASNAEVARATLQLYPADDTVFESS